MNLKISLSYLILGSFLISSCNNNISPTKVSTDNLSVVKKIELPQRTMTITYKENSAENPLFPEQLEYIEIVDKQTIRINANEIVISDKNFSTKATSKDKAIFNGKGEFVFKDINDNSVLKFKVKGNQELIKVPAFSDKNDKNLRILVEKNENGELKVSGGVAKENGSLDKSKSIFTVNKDDSGKTVFVFFKEGKKDSFDGDEYENNSKKGQIPKVIKSEKADENETKKIQENIVEVSIAAGFVGDWNFTLFNQSGVLNLRDKGEGANAINGNLLFEGKNYRGKGPYNPNEGNNTITVTANAIEPATGYSSNIRLKIEVKGVNKLDVTIEEISAPLNVLNGTLLHLNRVISLPETPQTQTTPTPMPTPTPSSRSVAITPFVMVTTFAGNRAFFGKKPEFLNGYQDISGSEYSFSQPNGIAIKSNGDIIVTDSGNNQIIKLNQNAMLNYLPIPRLNIPVGSCESNALSNAFGIAISRSDDVYVASSGSSKIKKVANCIVDFSGDTRGFQDGASSQISDYFRNTLHIPLVTVAKFDSPKGIAVDNSGNVYVADTNNNRIRKISNGTVSTIAGGSEGFADGEGTNAKFSSPSGIAIDNSGNIFVADTNNNRIRKITSSGIVSTIAGSSAGFIDDSGASSKFNQPTGLAIDSSGNIFVADTDNNKIRKITPSGIVSTIAGSDEGFADGKASDAKFNHPRGVAVDSSGNIFVADTNNNTIRKIK